MQSYKYLGKLLLAAVLGCAIGVGACYAVFKAAMQDSMEVSARYKLVLSVQSVQLLNSGDTAQVMALQERALVNAVKAGRIALAESNSAALKSLLMDAESYLKQHPNANTADWIEQANQSLKSQ